MTIDANGRRETGFQEANGHLQNVAARNEDGMSNSRGDGLRINRTENVKDGCEATMQVQQQQRSQGSMLHWETFLHIRSIKVLLVENDDSTRHVVAALLRNLNYEVIVAANGLQAWRILKDLSNHIDIVLTEVVMPCFSGIGLLCKIMSHKTRKTIPVIMMSSHDSMGLVFKCLSKGAVDFLGKPIRKNELKNLWKHVWRRSHSSSGSECESRTHTQLSVKSKSGVKCEKNSSSSSSKNEDENMNTGLKTDGIDEDSSDSQSSWTKEVDSSQAMSAKDQIAKRSDSTCAQLCSNAETFIKTMVHVTTPKEYQENVEQNDNVRHGKDLTIGKSETLELQLNNPKEIPLKLLNTNRITHSKLESYPNKTSRANNPANHCEHPFNKDKAIITKTPFPPTASEYHVKSFKSKIKALDNSKLEPEIELISSKRLRVAKDTGKAIQTERNVLRRSDLSAFSRYNKTSNGFKTPNGIDVNGSIEAVKDESDIRPCSNGNLLCPSSEGITNNVDMGSITDKLSVSPPVFSNTASDKLEATSAINDLNLSSVFAPPELQWSPSLSIEKRGEMGPGSHFSVGE